jgi:hypothetical protein
VVIFIIVQVTVLFLFIESKSFQAKCYLASSFIIKWLLETAYLSLSSCSSSSSSKSLNSGVPAWDFLQMNGQSIALTIRLKICAKHLIHCALPLNCFQLSLSNSKIMIFLLLALSETISQI